MSVVDEIKGRLDIAAYIQQYAQLKKAGRYYKACCPFHSEKTPSFTVNPDSQSWRCFGACAEGGDIFSFAMKMHGWSFAEALQELGRLAGVETRQQTPEQRQQSDALDHLRGLLKVAAEFYQRQFSASPEGAAALKYAREKRGFTDDTIAKFQVGYAPAGWQNLLNELKTLGYSEDQALDAGVVTRNDKGSTYDRFRNRLMIPIRDERGRVIGFGARALDPDDTPKYLNSPQSALFDKSKTLFGLDTGKKAIRDTETVVIVEGYMDAIQAQQAGFTNVVAQMGTALTETQLQLLAPRYAKRIILALDSDAAGQNATMRSLEVARQALEADYAGRLAVDMRVLRIPGAKDPDDLIRESPERWQELVDQAIPVADYVIELETAHLSASATVQEREAVAMRVLPLLTASENDLYRKDNLQKLAMRLRIAERDLLVWAQEHQIQEQRRPRPVQPAPVVPEDDIIPYMPPVNYDNLVPPDEEDSETGGADHVIVLPRRTATIQREYALEFYCLRILLHQPDLMYTVNRKFRELARENHHLIRGPLGDLSVDDFQHGDYRGFIHTLKLATRQDELDVIAYMRNELDPALVPEFERLFTDEADAVRERLRRRFDGDAIVSWKQHERHKVGMIDPVIELLDKALRLRLLRLQRELQEMQFLQMEADAVGSENYIQSIMLAMQAKRLIEAEIKQLSRHFV